MRDRRYSAERSRIAKKYRARTVEVPTSKGGLDLAYVFERYSETAPVLVILPGGPGLASIVPYKRHRALARELGLSVLMMEHRGVGCSRKLQSGEDIAFCDLSTTDAVKDLARILDHERIQKAWVYGSSYGGMLSQRFALAESSRVQGLVLDSTWPFAGFDFGVRDMVRDMFLNATRSDMPEMEAVRAQVHSLLQAEFAAELVDVSVPFYELFGPELLGRLLRRVKRGKMREWNLLRKLWVSELDKPRPFFSEFDLVGHIWFRELWAIDADHQPFDTAALFAARASRFTPERQPFDFRAELSSINVPTLLLSGHRDLRTPCQLSRQAFSNIRRLHHVEFPQLGHSMLDLVPEQAFTIAKKFIAQGAPCLPEMRALAENTQHPLRMFSPVVSAYLRWSPI